ncbi:PAS domain S-box protein, partial [Thermodesulfobacteriota bacterium]
EDRLGELEAANRVLTNERNRYLDIFESLSSPAILLDPHNRIENVNRDAALFLGRSLMPGSDYYRTPCRRSHGCLAEDDLVRPEQECLRMEPVEKVLPWLGGEPADFAASKQTELTIETEVSEDEDKRVLEVRLTRLQNMDGEPTGILVTINDVTERRSANNALVESEKRYRTVFDYAGEAIFVHDLGRRFIDVNRVAYERLGFSREELLRMGPKDISLPEDARLVAKRVKRLQKRGRLVFQSKHLTKHGTAIPVEITSRIITYGGKPAVLSLARDITERKRSEQLLLQTERLKAVAALSGGVSHNFNNVLQIVLGNAQLALANLNSGNTEDLKWNIEQILRSSRFAAETVKRLRNFVRGRTTCQYTEIFDLSSAAGQAIEMSKIWWKLAPERMGIQVKMSQDFDERCMVAASETELLEAVMNLIKNSAEALPEGGEIHVKTVRQDDQVLLQVRDNGVGIDPRNVSRVFDPFFTTKGYQRIGMGLASCHGIVKSHGGDIRVESNEETGTEFTIRLPYADTSSAEVPPTGSVFPWKLRVLAIDQTEPVLAGLKEGLEKHGHSVLTALSGSEGLRILSQHPVDIVVCGMGMPDMSGWAVGEALKESAREEGLNKPLFVLAADSGDQSVEKERIIRSGVDAILVKPIRVPKLLQTAHRLIIKSDQSLE